MSHSIHSLVEILSHNLEAYQFIGLKKEFQKCILESVFQDKNLVQAIITSIDEPVSQF